MKPAALATTAGRPPLVFITGASSGIGQALALQYYQQGWQLALVARRIGQMQDWMAQHAIDPARCQLFAADVSQPDSIIAAGQACLQQLGLPQIVIANAGISHGMNTAERADIAVMQQIFATNVTGVAATFHPFVTPMRQRGSGSLVGIASVAGVRGLPGHGAYSGSKAAVIAYCESLRGDMRGSGVQVTTLLPGYIATPMTAGDRFSLPFLLSAQEFARRARQAIARGERSRVIPWQMGLVAGLMRVLPDALWDRALADRPRKPRLTDTGTPGGQA